MKLMLLLIVAVGLTATGQGADAPLAPGLPESAFVGELGRKEALVLEGNKSFTKEQILGGVSFRLDYHLAAHPSAPLAAYLAHLEDMIALGYRHAGFPAVTVKAIAEPKARRVVVRVNEGSRYRCGEIVLSGVSAITNDTIRRAITAAVGPDGSGPSSNLNMTVWVPDKPAPLDEFSPRALAVRIEEALTTLNYYQPKLTVKVVPDPSRNLAELKVEMLDEGIKGNVAEIEVTGLHQHERPQLLNYLGLKTDMDVKANLVGTTSNRLWRSARFFRQDVSLATLPAVGQFRLTLDVDEVREAPPLHQEFSPKAQAMLKFRDWLAGWETRPEDFTFSLTLSNSWLHQHADIAFSASGFALVFRAPSSNSPAKPTYAIVTSDHKFGIYSIWRQAKFAIRDPKLVVQVVFQLRPPSPRSYGAGNIQLGMGVGILHPQPFRLELDLQPAVFVSMADWMETTLENGVLTLHDPRGTNSGTLRIETATGRLLEYSNDGNVDGDDIFTLRLRAEEGALARLGREIASATADHPNRCVTNRVFASWVSSMAADALESPLLERAIEALTSHEESASGAPLDVSSAARWIKPALVSARETLHQERLSTLLEPLTRIFSSPTEEDVEEDVETFTVPADDLTSPSATNPMAVVWSWVLHWSDTVLPRGSWPWVLLREATFTVAGEDRYSTGELEKLLKSEEVGPAGCLATALLLGRVRPPLAREFAEHGLARLNPKALHGDFKVLLHTNSVVGALAGNVLGWLGDLSEAQLSPLSAGLAPAGMEFMRQLARRIAETKGQPPGEAAWPVLEQHWDSILRPSFELGLNRFLPQVQFLTNSQALYERGLALVSPDGALQDADEAVQCFRKAAGLGHAGAQLELGKLCENGKGVPKDFAEAMRWYRKAAEQKEPHAMCRIGDLYHDGRGVRADLEEAARWYRVEAEGNCPMAQWKLGSILDNSLGTDAALPWYRRAAEGGVPVAQAKLGDLLSDGLFVKPDPVEACQWLSLAAESGDKLSEIRLGRLKTKMTVQQLEEAAQRAAAVTQSLEKSAKKASKASTR